MRLSTRVILLVASLLSAAQSQAQTYPSRPIRLVVPFTPGGTTDILARVMATSAGGTLGQTVLVENKPGGGSVIATEAVVRSKPDGYTLLLVSVPIVTNPGLYDKLPYDALRDLTPLIQLSDNGFVFAVNEKQPWKTMSALIEAARKTEGGISYASPGIGTVMHLTGQLSNAEYGTRFVNIPYKGSAQAGQDVAAGHVPMIIDPIATTLSLIQQGKLRALAVSHPARQKELPDVPTVRELGLLKLETRSFSGLMLPAGTPRDIVIKLNTVFNNAVANPESRAALAGFNLVGGIPEEFGAMLKTETERWVPLIRRLGIRGE